MESLHKPLSLFLFVFFSFSLFAQSSPPGTVKLKSSKTGTKHATFIDRSEVTTMAWLEYMFWVKKNHGEESAEYKALLPDSAVWLEIYPLDWRRPMYRNLPMVGISYEQAMGYCTWRTLVVNEKLKLDKEKYTVSYTLPTEIDFEEAYKQQKVKTDYKNLTNAVWKKNKLVYIADNAQELTADKTVITGEEVGKLIFEPYQEPNAMTGFRCVAEINK